MGARVLLVAALSAVLVASASGATPSSHRRAAYAGLGTWLDIYAGSAWAHPQREVAAMARDGVRTLYLQTGNYEQQVDLVRRRALGRFVDAAHAAGLRVVAWYLPALTDPVQDERRALAAIHFRSPRGERFDSFALDIEASLVRPVRLRNRRLLRLSAELRKAAGAGYALGAIIPSQVGMHKHPHYWPGFPYRSLARVFDVFLPMAYFTYRVKGRAASAAYVEQSVDLLRAAVGDSVPVHVIGGVAGTASAADVSGFMDAVAQLSPVGYSLYDFPLTTGPIWHELAP